MNFKLLSRFLGQLSLLLSGFMLLCVVWAFPFLGQRTDPSIVSDRFEWAGFWGLLASSGVSAFAGILFYAWGRNAELKIYRKEAMAIVGLGWLLATFLGALPFVFSGTKMGPRVRLADNGDVYVSSSRWKLWNSWDQIIDITDPERDVIRELLSAGAEGLSARDLELRLEDRDVRQIIRTLQARDELQHFLFLPGEGGNWVPADRAAHYRLRWKRMGLIDAMFESQSGFSTTGATVITHLEDPDSTPNCILFWRASTHFLGGLGIIVLFVALLGQGSVGKTLMRAEMPGPTKEGSTARMQHTAWLFAAVYVGLNVVLAIIYMALNMTAYDAICHAFATMATGGFSTYNASLGHFEKLAGVSGAAVDYITIIFMILAATNFFLIYLALIGKVRILTDDSEWRGFMAIIGLSTLAIVIVGLMHADLSMGTPLDAVRYGLFQVVSIMTTTGFCTTDFDQWHSLSKGLLLLLMFVGGCSGSTGGGMKVIRHLLFAKILRIEIEHSFHPRVVRLLRVGGKAVEDQELRRGIMVYFGLVGLIFALSWLFVLAVEPDSTWNQTQESRLIDGASAVIATLNNVGPGIGVVGATMNYANFSGITKCLFILLMMLGRLEIYPILVLFMPQFWRDQ
ncbi:MAG: TrkH family potassium uptake protein [Pirellulaceae bacterium]